MSELTGVVIAGLAQHFDRVRDKVHRLVEPLSTEQVWRRPFSFGNSIGHLLLHLTGNLSYYIGAEIAGSGYVRDRPREFSDPSGRPKDDVLRDFDEAVARVKAALSGQRDADWGAAYKATGAEDIATRFAMFVRCAAHADHHAGQIVYLAAALQSEGGPR
jgi:uncharacterized damage-inducible protein DinB